MQDYVIFHPSRSRYEVEGTASVNGSLAHPWQGGVWLDRITPLYSANEDPYVWSDVWLYSYCHASQLQRKPRNENDIGYVSAGSRLFFCEGGAARQGVLKVDTVFVVDAVHEWKEYGKKLPESFKNTQDNMDDERWKRHFRHGIRPKDKKGHKGLFTYTANHHPQVGSFLPLSEHGEPVLLEARNVLTETFPNLARHVPQGRSSYPLRITLAEADNLYQSCVEASRTMVLRITRALPNMRAH